jgi:LmbE family N-acetylglucosaminyl deacetylase
VEVLYPALKKLTTHRRLLVVAAHPDDEDTSLLALVGRSQGGEAAYLSLSRGEGGQNLIGPELGVGLGLIRSRELLAARQVDGARQFFTRAFDFGYTRSLEETLERWPREVLLEDVVRVMRRFRPQVVMSVFPGEPIRTHGQHQAAGVVAHQAFTLAGDPAFLPELKGEGLVPWAPTTLFRSTWFDRSATSLRTDLGVVEPIRGRSVFQIAMGSRSMHRSQDMGQVQDLGPRQGQLGWVRGGEGPESQDVFAGVDTRLSALAATLPEAEMRQKVQEHLEAASAEAEGALAHLIPSRLEELVGPLSQTLSHLEEARRLLEPAAPATEEAAVARLVEEKIEVARVALAVSLGAALDVLAESEVLVPGETVKLTVKLWNGGARSLEVRQVEVMAPEGFSITPGAQPESPELAAGALGEWELSVEIPAGAEPSLPYFLRRPLQGDLYDWSQTPAEIRGAPFEPPPLFARLTFAVDGREVTLEKEAVYRFRDQAVGEVRRPLRIAPPLEVAVEPGLLVWPRERREAREIEVTLARNGPKPLRGKVEVTPPPGWPAVAPLAFELAEDSTSATVKVSLEPPAELGPGRFPVQVRAVTDDGRRFEGAVPLVDYEHIRPTPLPAPSRLEVAVADIALPPLDRVGYVRGASDRVPEFLQEIGVPIELLSARSLLHDDLNAFDAIVVGSRAYETDPALGRANPRLLSYVRQGGLLLVQYQQYQFVRGGFAPYPLEISRPHDRVTDETAPVRALDPASPVLTWPNRIGEDDWKGWVQERGLYFAGTWDEQYRPVLAMADPGGEELHGSLLVASMGEGTYVYTGLAFFRQLPAGVPGAYRLFANLLALAAPEEGP